MMSLTCADCGASMKQVARSLPQGEARCHACRKARVKDYSYKKTLTCAGCGKALFRSRTSLPQGSATCLSCRRARSKAPPPPKKQTGRYRARPCADCGVTARGLRCRKCRDLAQRIRPPDHPDVLRWQREQSAPGLRNRERRALLRRWKRQGRTCAYCTAPATTIDHVHPLVRGGTNYEGNLAPCCKRCNSSKSGLTLIEWRTGKRLKPMTSWVVRPKTAKLAKPPKPVRVCAECGSPRADGETWVKQCSDQCRKVAKLRADRKAHGYGGHKPPAPCIVCGQGLYPLPLRRCPDCRREAKRAERRRARARRMGIEAEPYTLALIAQRDHYKCGLCRKPVAMTKEAPHPNAPSIHHLLPLSCGGDDTRANVQLAHFICCSKGADGVYLQLALVG